MGWEAAKNFGQIEHYLIDAGIDHAFICFYLDYIHRETSQEV